MVGQQIQLPGFGLGTVTSRAGDYYKIESEYPRHMTVYRRMAVEFKPVPCCLDRVDVQTAYNRARAWIGGMAA
jgi:hypothetical protein